MSNPLIPVQRPDKNGKVVTRHVRTGDNGNAKGLSIPAPSQVVKPVETELGQMKHDVLEAIENMGLTNMNPVIDETLEFWSTTSQKHHSDYLRELHRVMPKNPDDKDKAYFYHAFAHRQHRGVPESNLKVIAKTYEFCKKVDDQMQAPDGVNTADRGTEVRRTYEKSYAKRPYKDAYADDIKAEYLLSCLGYDGPNSTDTPSDFYRACRQITDNMEDIERTLPVLIATQESVEYFFDDIERVFELVDEFKVLPDDRMEAAAQFIRDRQDVDIQVVTEALETSSNSLMSGVL